MTVIQEKLTGKEFEQCILDRAGSMNEWDFGRYGVKASFTINPQSGKPEWMPIKSLPDFEAAVKPIGRQVIIEAKTCSGASYQLACDAKRKKLQFEHLLRRSEAGARCWLLVHFNRRRLKTKVDEPFTVAISVAERRELFFDASMGVSRNIGRSEAKMLGHQIEWGKATPRCRNVTPDLSLFIEDALNIERGLIEPVF